MIRSSLIALALLLIASGWTAAQDPIADLPNLVSNAGFEEDTTGWQITIGPYGRAADRWEGAKGVAEIVDRDAYSGERCLRLNAGDQDTEVDVYSGRFAVEAGVAYLLASRVRQLAGDAGYKVVIDWMDADGEHISYDNDWRGNDRPVGYVNHGGVFIAPEDSAQAAVLVGVQKTVECYFDEIRLSPLPVGPGEDVPDGVGEVEAILPNTIEAGGHATFRFTYRAGESGLPVGATVSFRRDNTDPRWSPPQTTDPTGVGYTTVEASNGALCVVQPGAESKVPSVTRIALQYPPLQPGDTLSITYGDTSQGSPGARVQPKVESDIRFVLAVDGDRDGRFLDLPDTQGFDVAPAAFAQLGLITPVVAEAGTPFVIYLEARDKFGNTVPTYNGDVAITSEGEGSRLRGQVRFAQKDKGRHPVRITLKRPGVRALAAEAGGAKAEQVIVVSNSPSGGRPGSAAARALERDGTYILQNRHVRLLLPPNDFGYGVGMLEARDDGEWKRVGVLASMGQIWTGKRGEETENAPIWLGAVTPDSAGKQARLSLTGEMEAGGVTWGVSVECTLTPEARHVDLRCAATPRESVALRAFYAPSLYAGDGGFRAAKRSALFPGLEYLTADEVSSGDYGIVPPHSERTVPHPFKITIPMMAVAGDGVCSALFWDPLQTWLGDRRYPSACFASPERRDDRDCHFLGLFAPSILDGLPENARQLEEPMTISAGRTLALSTSAVALAPADDVTEAVRYWFEIKGVPDAPPLSRNWDEAGDLVARGFLETAWDDEEKGWHGALADPWGPGYHGQMALSLWHYAKANPGSPLTPRIESQLSEAFEAAGGMHGFGFAFHSGTGADALNGERSAGLRDALAMAEDGSYAFHPHTGSKTFSQAQSKSMGEDGEVVVGTCVMGLEPLMRRALLTGDPFLIAQGEKGLAFIDRFARPQGAENWEVPLACPNLRASALALRCYLYGYLLTGKPEYLEKARFWATTGLPFIYMWNADERPVMRYASISVMGTTLHTGTWFGRAVQWVGLAYAEALHELAAHDDSFPWDKVAEGILISAVQQQKTDSAECGHVGFYPDAYSAIEGDEAYHWCLAPTLIANLRDAMHGIDPKASTTVLREGERTIHIVSAGAIVDASFDAGKLTFTSRYLAGSAHDIVVVQVSGADEVLLDGAPLAESEPASADDLGWQALTGMIRLRIRHASEDARLELRGCRLAEPEALADVSALANGDFEQGTLHWSPDSPSHVRRSDEAHGGESALELDGVGRERELQCTGRPMTVAAGKTYELTAWVKQPAGDGSYKVTIDWLGVGGHIDYANDWTGTNRPPEYTQHGGRFVAPEGARIAIIILGVREGTRCLFDDISLRPVD